MASLDPSGDILGIPPETFKKVMALSGILLLASLWQNLSSSASPVEVTTASPFPTAVAATYTGEPVFTPTPTKYVPLTGPTTESFRKTGYVEMMRFMDATFTKIAPYYKGGSPDELSGIGISLMLTETAGDTKNWLQIEKPTQKEALADLRRRIGEEGYKKITAGKDTEELSLIAGSVEVAREYEAVVAMTDRGEPKETRRALVFSAYNGGQYLTADLWSRFRESSSWKKESTWADFSDYVEKNSTGLGPKVEKSLGLAKGYLPPWLADVKVYRSRAEQLYGFAIQWHYDFLRGDVPSEQEVQQTRTAVFTSAPARVR